MSALFCTNMLPWDCLLHIVSYCRLRERGAWSVAHRDFAFTRQDWQRFGEYYSLDTSTRTSIKDLLARRFDSQTRVTRLERHLWSSHLREPLRLWSPWTPGKYCKRFNKMCVMLFRHFAFVNFVRDIACQFKLKTSLLTHTGVQVKIWTKNIPMAYISKGARVQKLHISSAFKRFEVARVMLVFHVRQNVLHLHPRRLEFLT